MTDQRRLSTSVSIFFVALLVTGGWLSIQIAAGYRAGEAAVRNLARAAEPVIVTGDQLPDLLGSDITDIYVYAYNGSRWDQIPSQVDELTAADKYANFEDGIFDSNDELVFVAKDSGLQMPSDFDLSEILPIKPLWIELSVMDPISGTGLGWVSVVESIGITETVATDYVSFDPLSHGIQGENYRIEFDTPRPWVDYLTIGESNVDLIDRNKSLLNCSSLLCPVTEETLTVDVFDDPIKDGPVRTIIRNGRVIGYGESLSWSTGITIPNFLLTGASLNVSLDFSAGANGGTFYNAAVPAGVTVDGFPDLVPGTPLSPWLQLATDDATLIQVTDLDSITGTVTNVYEDDATFDASDTGDNLRYGQAGYQIDNPTSPVIYVFNLYVLNGEQPNRGDEYTSYFLNPLAVEATPKMAPLQDAFLPLITSE